MSATGSGKTFLAAFDALNFAPNRLLYVVHEGSILHNSLTTFQKVFGGLKTCGKLLLSVKHNNVYIYSIHSQHLWYKII